MRRALTLLVVALALTACNVETTLDVEVRADGTGIITLTSTADAEVVAQAPGLAEDLRFDDAIVAGWEVAGPEATDAGGLTVTLTHTFDTVDEATALLLSINGQGGPLHDVAFTRTVLDGDITNSLTGTLRVDGGIDAFADPDLLAAIGGTPYADNIAATGLRPTDVVTFTFTADMPGDVVTPSGGTAAVEQPLLSWSVPLDGTTADLATTTIISEADAEGSGVWGTVATVALIALIAWVVLAIAFIVFVARARKQRAQRRRPGTV